ncbi:tryptophan synthase subunit alpha [Treponema sp. J25]|uniref:tryptophan synthase subunit alpha n=1 Tax=Treponema sp. J25 TaxID=2094121 RepID=UPI00104AD0D2|nr:tryptophan synthase subunit alpha [Treponema sp. J25]TCW62119.1 tryptophan synthase subunit alpha [Treponema sp. J25]
MDKIRLMAHLVAGFPDASGCRAAAEGLIEGGASYLEIQIPFSDPSADGPVIQSACAAALANGYSVSQALDFLESLHRDFPQVPLFVMAYASLVVTPGVEQFVHMMAQRGVMGLIVPDLPFDRDEGLAEACAHQGLVSIPVAAPSMRSERLERMAHLGRAYLYAALRTGITGTTTTIGEGTLQFLKACAAGGSKVLGGFGIRSHTQARAVAPLVHAVVAGSVFVETIQEAVEAHRVSRSASFKGSIEVRDTAIRENIRQKAQEITRGE